MIKAVNAWLKIENNLGQLLDYQKSYVNYKINYSYSSVSFEAVCEIFCLILSVVDVQFKWVAVQYNSLAQRPTVLGMCVDDWQKTLWAQFIIVYVIVTK